MTITKNTIFNLTPHDIKEIIAKHMSNEFNITIAPSNVQLDIINSPVIQDEVIQNHEFVGCTICYQEAKYAK